MKTMVLLTFNFKNIDELTGNPPILIDVQGEKSFKDVLLDVIGKINPLLPAGSKLTLESLGIESFDGEPVSWGTYGNPVSLLPEKKPGISSRRLLLMPMRKKSRSMI
jgi:hypothetical protein